MKTLLAAALLLPTVVLANDLASKTPSEIIHELHDVSQRHIEKASLAQGSASTESVRQFARQQTKDFQSLDQSVMALAKERSVMLTTAGDAPKPVDAMVKGKPGSNVQGSPTMQMGTAGDTRTATNAVELKADPAADPAASPAERVAGQQDMENLRARLTSLTGAAWDLEYLAMTIEGAKNKISMLEAARDKGDRGLTRVVDSALKLFKSQLKTAEKLQRDLRRS